MNIEPSKAANSSNFDLGELRKGCATNPIIGYLNINSLRNIIVDLKQVLYESELDIISVLETKLSDEFPNPQFNIEGYYNPAQLRKDRTWGGLVVYVKTGVPVKRVHALEPANLDVICSEITTVKRKWLIYSFYRSETFTQLPKFLEELKKSVDMAINKYENNILMVDINVDMSSLNELKNVNYYDVNEFCDIFSFTNLIKQTTWLTPTAKHPSLIDIILTNRPKSFKNSVAIETCLSDHHKMVVTVLKCHFVRIQPKTIQYRDYHQFNADAFIADLIQRNLNSLPVSILDPNKAYAEFCDTFKTILDKHAPLKSKVLRGNHAPFITKELSKGIMIRSRLKNKFNRHRTKENWNAYKIQRNDCVQLRKKAVKSSFEQNTKSVDVSNKLFWETIRPFLCIKGTHGNHDIILEENGDLIKDKENISDILNVFHINIVEKTTGKKPLILNLASTVSADEEIDIINRKYDNNPSIRKIKENVSPFSHFSLNYATDDTILKILLSLDISKEAGYDTLPSKVIKLAAPIIVTPLTKIINMSISVSKILTC